MILEHKNIVTKAFKNGVIAATRGASPTKMPVITIMLSYGHMTLLSFVNGHFIKCETENGLNSGDDIICPISGQYLLNFVKHAKSDVFNLTVGDEAATFYCGSLQLTLPISDAKMCIRDRDYITNSYHVPVFEEIGPFDKIKKEAEFQRLSPGGAISYIESSNLQNNLPVVETVIRSIYDNIMYAELNTKLDVCKACGYEGEMRLKRGKRYYYQ